MIPYIHVINGKNIRIIFIMGQWILLGGVVGVVYNYYDI